MSFKCGVVSSGRVWIYLLKKLVREIVLFVQSHAETIEDIIIVLLLMEKCFVSCCINFKYQLWQ